VDIIDESHKFLHELLGFLWLRRLESHSHGTVCLNATHCEQLNFAVQQAWRPRGKTWVVYTLENLDVLRSVLHLGFDRTLLLG